MKSVEKGFGQFISVANRTCNSKRVFKIESCRTTSKMPDDSPLHCCLIGSRKNRRASEGSDEVSEAIAVDIIQCGRGCRDGNACFLR